MERSGCEWEKAGWARVWAELLWEWLRARSSGLEPWEHALGELQSMLWVSCKGGLALYHGCLVLREGVLGWLNAVRY